MKTRFLFIAALIHGACIIGMNVKGYGQGITKKIGTMYLVTDSLGNKMFSEVWDASCPVKPNIYIHDTMWQIPGGYQVVRPSTPPIPYFIHDTTYVKVHDTVCLQAMPALTSIFTTQALPTNLGNDLKGIELGVKFRSALSGYIRGIRFYKVAGNSGIHTGELYSSTGTRMAQAVFTSETASGWQTVQFTTPIAILANTTYVAAYFSPNGTYTGTLTPGLATSITNAPLSTVADGLNGVYNYSTSPSFPSQSYKSQNYWVDVIFSTK